MNHDRALVLGGGGVAGIAWETGLLMGLADAGVDVTDAEVVVGTSAGSTVAAQITSGAALADLFARQFTSAEASGELAAALDVDGVAAMFIEALRRAKGATELRVEIGRAALAAATVPERTRRAVIEHRLPSHEWPPGRDVRLIAVAADTGALRVFTCADDVSIVDAVAASCAVPGVWPPVTIGEQRYIDGGVRTSTNADLAEGCDVILVLAPVMDVPLIADDVALAAIERLSMSGSSLTIRPNEESTAAIGQNPLDLATRSPAATAGRIQGRLVATEVDRLWNRRGSFSS